MGKGGVRVMLDYLTDEIKLKIIDRWKLMSETDKAHFINQVALALSVWGSDEKGRELVVEVLKYMGENGTTTLADFGIYAERLLTSKSAAGRIDKVKRACLILEGYRIKNSLPSEPHKELQI